MRVVSNEGFCVNFLSIAQWKQWKTTMGLLFKDNGYIVLQYNGYGKTMGLLFYNGSIVSRSLRAPGPLRQVISPGYWDNNGSRTKGLLFQIPLGQPDPLRVLTCPVEWYNGSTTKDLLLPSPSGQSSPLRGVISLCIGAIYCS